MNVCDDCKEVEICSCENFCIAPDGGITTGVDYIVTVVDKFGFKYTQEITGNAYGTLCIDISPPGFPKGFFNPFAGQLILSVALASTPLVPIQLIYGSLEYECISLIVKECPNSTSDVVIDPNEDTACCEPITHTVLEMQALVGSFEPNRWYIITDPQSSFGVLRIRARDASNLESKGTLLKGGRAFDVNYVLDDGGGNDIITYFRDELYNNTSTNLATTVSITPIIPIDGSWYNNDFIDCQPPTIPDISAAQIANSYIKTATLNLSSSTLSSLNSVIAMNGGTINTGGVSSVLDSVWMINGGIVNCTDATIHSTTLDNESIITADGNGALFATSANLNNIKNNSTLIVMGINGGNGTVVTRCNISEQISITIKGGESYSNKEISQSISTFDGSRVIAGDGAFSFIDSSLIANYNRSFIGQWLISAVAPRNITSLTDNNYTHNKTFRLDAGSSPITFTDNGVDIIMKGSSNAVLANEGDYVTFRFVGNVAYEIDRGIY